MPRLQCGLELVVSTCNVEKGIVMHVVVFEHISIVIQTLWVLPCMVQFETGFSKKCFSVSLAPGCIVP